MCYNHTVAEGVLAKTLLQLFTANTDYEQKYDTEDVCMIDVIRKFTGFTHSTGLYPVSVSLINR